VLGLELGLRMTKEIIWSKSYFIFGRWEYHWQHEACLYGWRKGYHRPFYGERSESTVWRVDREGGYKTRNGQLMKSRGLGDHPTQKPPELWARAMRNHTKPGELAYDPFAGPAVIAAEQEGRIAHAMDIDPAYCDVIVRRWERVSGQQAVRESA
jgi:DNA modification methylase